MENGIPALFIGAIIMLSTVLIARGGFLGMDAVAQSLHQSESRHGDQIRTELTVTSATTDVFGANITITLRNDGQTRVADFAGMDVVVEYFGLLGIRYSKYIPYTSGALAPDTWTTGTFTGDVFEPGILNTGESMQVLIRVNPVVAPATTNWAIIGTENGVAVQAYFAGP
jgi:hypothetical protein